MKRSLGWIGNLVVGFTGLCLVAGSAFADTDIAKISHDGRYIYYDTAWTHFSHADQVEVIQKSIDLLKSDLSAKLSAIPGVKTLTNSNIPPATLDDLVTKAQQLVTLSSSKGRDLFPAGFMVFGGGSMEAALLAKGKVSGDIGLVILPSKETKIDTLDASQSSTYFKLQWNIVVTPHGYGAVGPGVALGPSGSVGVDFIFGNLNNVHDFSGTVIGAGADVKLLAGADVEIAWVHNLSANKNFLMLGGEFDFGAEAGATADAEGGAIIDITAMLNDIGAGFAAKKLSGTTDVPASTPVPGAPVPTSN